MKACQLCSVAAVISFALVNAGAARADPRGLWLAQDGAQVRVAPCGQALCATLAAPKTPIDPETGASWTDKHNHDPGQRGRPLVGVYVLYNMVPDGPGKWSGTLYNVDNGNTYPGHLLDVGPETIRIEGCVLLCGGQNLSRLR
jgi:uncharacterized protein (DUF2147 family)